MYWFETDSDPFFAEILLSVVSICLLHDWKISTAMLKINKLYFIGWIADSLFTIKTETGQ